MARAALVSLVLLAGCDPGFTLHGDVVDAYGRPIPDAQIVFACDRAMPHELASDTAGRFRGHWLGAFDDDCSVEIRRPGAKAVSYGVMANCTHPYDREGCTEVTVHAVLP